MESKLQNAVKINLRGYLQLRSLETSQISLHSILITTFALQGSISFSLRHIRSQLGCFAGHSKRQQHNDRWAAHKD